MTICRHCGIFWYGLFRQMIYGKKYRLICRPCFERRFDIIDDTGKADCGFFAVIDKTEIPHGTYRLETGLKSRLKLKRPVFCVSTGRVLKL